MITPEETGSIVARLAIHNEVFLRSLLREATNAGDTLLPDDVAKLESWAMFIRALRGGMAVSNKSGGGKRENSWDA